jgi:hypothetical protein
MQEHSMVIQNVFNSISLETIKRYLFKVAYNLLITFSEKILEGRRVPADELALMANFYSHAFVGVFLDWIRGGMKEKPETFINMLSRILNGSIYDVLRRSAIPPYEK